MPLAWDEVGPAIGPGYFTVENATVRVRNLKSDPWADFRKAEKPLPVGLTGSRKGRRAA